MVRGVAVVLPAENRLRSSGDFARVVRSDRRAGRPTLILHIAARPHDVMRPSVATGRPRVGLVVGKGVGNSVVRHRVSRRLRAQLAARLYRLSGDFDVVVRARSTAASASSTELGADIDSALDRVLRRPVRP